MARIRLSGTPVDFVTRKGFEELVGVKPPKLKVTPLDATLDSPHYAQWTALTNSPDPALYNNRNIDSTLGNWSVGLLRCGFYRKD